ncbi:hypothetical protein PHAVU_009G083000 [Phaseolus vulgaris]|uniref:Uncharacterized protein n=1 Tax=Phaseolus vulgaris TaxID=3885 RepID=V7AW95_PHAVU|nr:hypothetical protein PHAVU_009G083000g [Phaseolus vulgaris]ESW08888.1 hypothetical protein PHAVU_009G083000g [Phaseolus vulgaris]
MLVGLRQDFVGVESGRRREKEVSLHTSHFILNVSAKSRGIFHLHISSFASFRIEMRKDSPFFSISLNSFLTVDFLYHLRLYSLSGENFDDGVVVPCMLLLPFHGTSTAKLSFFVRRVSAFEPRNN